MRDTDPGIDVADVYAAALFELATEANAVDDVFGELTELVKLVDQEPRADAFFSATSIDDDDREKSLERMFRGKLSDMVLNTLQIMNQHGRVGLLRPLRRAFMLRMEDARGQIEVTATSAVELNDQQRTEIAGVAEQLSGRQPLIEYQVDPEVLGGLVLQIGDQRYDNSLRTQLRAAATRLTDRANRGLEIGRED